MLWMLTHRVRLSVEFFSLYIYFIDVSLTCNVSGTQQGDSITYIHTQIVHIIFRLFPIIGYYKILTVVPTAIQ